MRVKGKILIFRNTWSGTGVSAKDTSDPVFQAVGEDSVDAVYDMGMFYLNVSLVCGPWTGFLSPSFKMIRRSFIEALLL